MVEGLARVVGEAGYRVDTVSFPYQWDPPEKITESCLAWRLFKPDESPADKPDLVVATKFPSYAVDHPNKVAWVLHQHRSAYDLKDTIYDDFKRYDGAEGYRDLIREIDRKFLSECKRVFTISKLVSSRIKEFCGKESEVVYHPPPLDGRYESGDYGNDVLVVGRLEPLKRVDLAIKAMKHVRHHDARLRVIGRGFLEKPLKELAVQ